MDTRAYQALCEPRSVVFLGASTQVFKWGFTILHTLYSSGFEGHIYPVNPQGGTWYGHRIYRDLREIEGPVDLAVIVVRDTLVRDVLSACIAKKIPAGIVITAGFSETGEDGGRHERELAELAISGGMRLVGPNTMGIFSAYPSPLQITMASLPIMPGPVGIITQSGNLGTSLTYRFLRRSIGISRLISSGNEADLTTEDHLEYLAGDPHTRIICLYVEGLRRAGRFFELAREITPRKPLLLLHGGRTLQGACAAHSHTGAISSDASIFSAMCRQCGIIQVPTMDAMIEVAGVLLTQPPAPGRRVGIITPGGGWGVLATDLCLDHGLSVPALTAGTLERIDALLPSYWSRANPVDLVAPGGAYVLFEVAGVLLESAEIDTVILMGLGYTTLRMQRLLSSPVVPRDAIAAQVGSLMHDENNLFESIQSLIRTHGRPVIPVMDLMVFDAADNAASRLDAQGLMAFPSPAPAIAALARATL